MPKPSPAPAEAVTEGIEVFCSGAHGSGAGLAPFPDSDGIQILDGSLIVTRGREQLAAFAPGAWVMAARPSVMRACLKVEPETAEGGAS